MSKKGRKKERKEERKYRLTNTSCMNFQLSHTYGCYVSSLFTSEIHFIRNVIVLNDLMYLVCTVARDITHKLWSSVAIERRVKIFITRINRHLRPSNVSFVSYSLDGSRLDRSMELISYIDKFVFHDVPFCIVFPIIFFNIVKTNIFTTKFYRKTKSVSYKFSNDFR